MYFLNFFRVCLRRVYSSRGLGGMFGFLLRQKNLDEIVCFFEKRNFFWIVYCAFHHIVLKNSFSPREIYSVMMILYTLFDDDDDKLRGHNKNVFG